MAQPIVEPLRPMAGTQLRVRQVACAPPNSAFLSLEGIDLPAIGADNAWSATLPETLEPRTYSVRWKCGTPDPKDMPQLGVIEVLSLTPRVISVSNLTKADRAAGAYELKDVAQVKVRNLRAWQQIPANTSAIFHLFLAGTELRNITAAPTGADAGDP